MKLVTKHNTNINKGMFGKMWVSFIKSTSDTEKRKFQELFFLDSEFFFMNERFFQRNTSIHSIHCYVQMITPVRINRTKAKNNR